LIHYIWLRWELLEDIILCREDNLSIQRKSTEEVLTVTVSFLALSVRAVCSWMADEVRSCRVATQLELTTPFRSETPAGMQAVERQQ